MACASAPIPVLIRVPANEGGTIGLLGKIFKRGKREDRLTQAPVSKPSKKRTVHRSGARRTRKQIVGRRRAMAGRKVNVQRLRKERAS